MFPNSDFKENYLYTSNESVNRKEDRILNRDYSDPYKLERKIADMYERDDNSKKFNLNTQPNDSFKATLGMFSNISSSPGNMLIQEDEERENNFSYENYHKRNFSSPMSPEEEIIPNLNYKYEDHNKFKREGGHSKHNSNLSEISTGRNNHRYKSKSNFSEEFNPNTQSNPIVNVSYIKDIKTEQHDNYNNELKYYKEMIEKMHSEIGNLNTKLSDIEKNNLSNGKNNGHLGVNLIPAISGVSGTFNNLIHNNPSSSTRSFTNSQLSTANFRKDNSKHEVSELVSEKNSQRDLQDINIGKQGYLNKLRNHSQLSNLNELGLKNKTEQILNITNTEKIISREHVPLNMNYNYDNIPLLQKREYILKNDDEKNSSYYIDYKENNKFYIDKEREKNETLNFNMKIKRPDSPSQSHKNENTEGKLIHSLGLLNHTQNSNNNELVSNLISKNKIPSNEIKNTNKTPSRITRKEKSSNSISTKTRSTSVDKFKRNNSNNKLSEPKSLIYQSSPSNNHKITKSTGKNISSNKHNLLNQINPTTKKPSVSSIRRNSKQECEIISNLQKENEELKSKITNLEKSLKNINYQLSLDGLEKKGRDYLRVELDIWKNRSETIANSYLETMSNMKKQLLQDKAIFVDQIKSMQSNFTGEINQLKNKYQSTIEKYENSIKRLRKDNEELKIKVSRVKEILTPNNK